MGKIYLGPRHPHQDRKVSCICDQCGKTYCWCNSSDWEEGLLNMEDPSSNPSIEKTPSPTVRKPAVGWPEYRHRVIMEAEQTRPP